MLVTPVIMGLELATFRLCGEHDDDARILLPYNVPEVLYRIS